MRSDNHRGWVTAEVLALGHGVVELHARRFVPTEGGPVVPLTQREVDLLAYLARHPGRMIGREELAREVWSEAPEVATRTVDTAIHRLRAKLEVAGAAPPVLFGGAGEGLRLNLPAHARAAVDAAVPRAIGELVGYDAEVAELVERIHGGDALVVVVGEQGTGKSRIAAEAVSRIRDHGRMAVRWVRLDGVQTAGTLRHAVADALQVDGVVGDDVDERIRAALIGVVLVLDGLDGPIDAAAELVPRWTGAPSGTLVGTCAAPLLVAQEQVIEVPPLDADAARALFVACASVAGRAPIGSESDVVDTIVASTGGNPLALEVAAVWSALIDPASVLARIDAVRDGASGRADPLSVVIGAVWQLLTAEEQEALLVASTFPGRFEPRSVAAMCDAPARVPAVLLALRRKALVSSAGGRLLVLPSPVRTFLEDERAARGQAADLAGRFSQHAYEQAVDLSDRFMDPAGAGAGDDEIARAVVSLGGIADPAVRVEVLLALGPALDAAGWSDVHREWLDRTVREPVPDDLRALVLERRASVLLTLGDPGAGEAIREAARAAQDGDPVLRALVALDEAALAGVEGRGDEVLVRTRQAADLVRSAGRGSREDGRSGPVWMIIGANLLAAGDRAGAEAAYAEVVRNARVEGSHRRAALAFVRLANLAIEHGDVAGASLRVGEAEAELRVIGSRAPASLLRVRGALAELRGDGPLAEAEWRELATQSAGADGPWARIEAQLGLARCAVRREDLESAWDVLAAAASNARGRWLSGWVEASALLALVHVRLGQPVEAERILAELVAARIDEARAFVGALVNDAPLPPRGDQAPLLVRLRYAVAGGPRGQARR